MKKSRSGPGARVSDLTQQSASSALTLAPDDPVKEVLATLAEKRGTGQAYVVDAEGRLCGTLSLFNLLEQKFPLAALMADDRRVPSRKGARGAVAREVMRLRPLYVTGDTRLVDAVRILLRERVTEIAVVDARMRFLGELTAARLLAAVDDPASEDAPVPARAPLRPALIPAAVNPW